MCAASTIKVISERSGLALVLQWIACEMDPCPVDHPAFGVMENQSVGLQWRGWGAFCLHPYNVPLNLLGNWRIGILLRHDCISRVASRHARGSACI